MSQFHIFGDFGVNIVPTVPCASRSVFESEPLFFNLHLQTHLFRPKIIPNGVSLKYLRPRTGAEIKAMQEVKTQIYLCTFEGQNRGIVLRTAAWLPGWLPFFSLYSSLLLVFCGEKALLVCLFFYSVDIPNGENPEFLIKCKALHIQGDIWDGSQPQSLQCPTPRAETRDLETCVTSSMFSLTASLCFKCMSRPCTQRRNPAKEFLPASQ